MKMLDILRVAKGLAEPPQGLWEKIKEKLNKNMLICAECGRGFIGSKPQRQKAGRGKNVLCGPVCIASHSSRTMAQTNSKYASDRMTKHNPMSNSASRKKMVKTLKRVGHKPTVRGGNGTGFSPAEKVLSEATGFLPYTVSTKGGRAIGLPTHYKLDLAAPEKKLAVEVDGRSHQALSRQEQDRRKELFLRSLGWTVLRFTNKEALEETEKCCEIIKTTASMLSLATT
jgi:hypothetical protein